jgi:hypothetical protein
MGDFVALLTYFGQVEYISYTNPMSSQGSSQGWVLNSTTFNELQVQKLEMFAELQESLDRLQSPLGLGKNTNLSLQMSHPSAEIYQQVEHQVSTIGSVLSTPQQHVQH